MNVQALIPALASVALALAPAPAAAGFQYWDVRDISQTPKTLAATGLYLDIAAEKKILVDNAWKYHVNAPSWSDEANQQRWVLLKPGRTIPFEKDNDYWTYPDSTVFVKQLSIDTIPGDSTSRVAYETRILILKKEQVEGDSLWTTDTWYGFSYKWNADRKNARLIPPQGRNDSIRIHPGLGKPAMMKKWRFPSRDECLACHRNGYADSLHSRSVLGFFTAQLNRPHADSTALNQIEYFFRRNVFSGTRPNYSGAPKWSGIGDAEGSDDQKARAYIAANCSGCHGSRGMGTGATNGVTLDFDYHTNEARFEFRHRSTSWYYGLDTLPPFYYPESDTGDNPSEWGVQKILPALVVPGYPDKSVLLFRLAQRREAPGDYNGAPNQMPPLGVFEKDRPALELLRRWILEMPRIRPPSAVDFPIWIAAIRPVPADLKGPSLQGRQMVIPAAISNQGRAEISMASIKGLKVRLIRMDATTFTLPNGLPRGLYIIKVGDRNFTRHLF